jgi:division protein CdvB (Snf7/Vps24/ESCRT-III family)
VIAQLEVQVEKLRRISQRMTSRGRELFEMCVRAQQQKDGATASMYATEAAQMRKMSSVVIKGELSLERVALRLRSIIDFKNALESVGPAIRVIEQVQSDLRDVAPEVSANLASLNDTLDELIISSGTVPSGFADTAVVDQEAQKILQEASAVAEQRVRNSFPDMGQAYSSWERR